MNKMQPDLVDNLESALKSNINILRTARAENSLDSQRFQDSLQLLQHTTKELGEYFLKMSMGHSNTQAVNGTLTTEKQEILSMQEELNRKTMLIEQQKKNLVQYKSELTRLLRIQNDIKSVNYDLK